MKTLLAVCIFAIGLMVALPDPSLGSSSPPDQVSFVVGHFDIAPVMANVQDYIFVAYQSQLAPIAIERLEKGGAIVEKSITSSLDIGYLNKDVVISKVPIYKLNCDYGFLLCLDTDAKIQSQNLLLKNYNYNHRFARDGLTQVC